MVAVHRRALKLAPENRLRMRLATWCGIGANSGCAEGSDVRSVGVAPDAAAHRADSTMPRLRAHVTIATTNRWPTTIRIPRSPYGESTNASTNTTIGPRLQAIWVRPRSL